MVKAVFTQEAELTLFLRMRTKEIAKTSTNQSINQLFYSAPKS